MLKWLFLDLNSYFASVEQQMNPDLRGKPVAIVPVMTDSTCAIAASYEAKKFGIRTGTPIYEAKKKCPDLICILGKHNHYLEYHHKILEEIDKHIPIGIVASIDEVGCELMGRERNRDNAVKIAKSIKGGIRKNIGECLTCSIGIAPNRYLAKVATNLEKPDGLTVLEERDLPYALFSMGIQDLTGIGYNMAARLKKAGINDIGALWKLNPQELKLIWGGVQGHNFWRMLHGEDVPYQETTRRTVGHSHVLSPELRPVNKARIVARRLVSKAASRVRRLGFYSSEIHLSVKTSDHRRWIGYKKCYRTQDSMTFLNILNQLWKQMLIEMKTQSIRKISITLYNLTDAADIAPELLTENEDKQIAIRKKREKLCYTLDNINKRYGKDTVTIGIMPSYSHSFSGTKIAFTRIPDFQEFYE